MLSKKLIDAINEQINYELASGYLYLSMAAYAVDKNYTGAASFLKKQAHEETEHALKFVHFMEEMNARVVLKGISDPQVEFEGFKDLFEKITETRKISDSSHLQDDGRRSRRRSVCGNQSVKMVHR